VAGQHEEVDGDGNDECSYCDDGIVFKGFQQFHINSLSFFELKALYTMNEKKPIPDRKSFISSLDLQVEVW
jgi:hypothetical protein